MLKKGESYVRHIPGSAIAEQAEKKGFRATTDFALLEAMDTILICVPTPLDQHREPDLSFVRNTTEATTSHLRRGQSVVLESTTYQGTTEVDYHDPYFPRLHRTRKYDFGMAAVEPTAEAPASYAAVVIVTDHSSCDYAAIVRSSRLVVDTRNATKEVKEHRDRIVLC
jgi:UDP-N-acetyl-D-glucosamine dehydrogenase